MVIRTYCCGDCDTIFEVTLESGNDPDPDCPNCSKVLEWRPTRFAVGGSNEGKAVKMAQNIMENDYGLSNYKDNNKEGDVGYIAPTKTTAQKEQEMQRESEAYRAVVSARPELKTAADSFFGGQVARIGNNQVPVQQMIAAGKSGPGAEVNPMEYLHKMGKEGKLPNNYRIIARDSGK